MKECPFCKAQIEENARFCLYCMKPLVEKEIVPPARENRRLIWLLPVLTVFLIIGVLAAVLLTGDPPVDPPMADTTAPITAINPENASTPEETDTPTITAPTQGTEPTVEDDPTQETNPPVNDSPTQETKPPVDDSPTQETKPPVDNSPTQETNPPVDDSPTQETKPPAGDNPTQETKPPVEDDPTPPATEPLPCAHNYLLQTEEKPTCTQDGSRRFVCSACGDVKLENSPATGHQFQDATCEKPKTCKVCQVTEGAALGHSYSDNICTRCGDKQNIDTNQSVTYLYHLAEAEDLGLSSYHNEHNDIVITGVNGRSPNGEYTIPSYIDGMRVRAIMPEAFIGTNVTKVRLGATIEIIWYDAFSDCDDLTDIYFAGEYLDIWPDAFPHMNSLDNQPTIHCSATCHDADMRLYKNMTSLNWEEWNGEL